MQPLSFYSRYGDPGALAEIIQRQSGGANLSFRTELFTQVIKITNATLATGIGVSTLGKPAAPSLVVNSGGTIPAGTLTIYALVFQVGGFQSPIGATAGVTIGSPSFGNQTVDVSWAGLMPAGCTDVYVYRWDNTETLCLIHHATISGGSPTTWSDTGAASFGAPYTPQTSDGQTFTLNSVGGFYPNLTIGERIVIGEPPAHDAVILQTYSNTTGIGTVYPSVGLQHAPGDVVQQRIPTLVPINGFDPVPQNCWDEGYTNDISQHCDDWTIEADSSRDVTRELKVVIHEWGGLKIDPFRHIIKCFVSVLDEMGGNVIWDVYVGTYRCAQATRATRNEDTQIQITGQDWSSFIEQCCFMNSYVVPTGSPFTGVVMALLSMDYLPIPPGNYLPSISDGTGATASDPPLPDAGPNIPFRRLQIPYSSLSYPYTDIYSPDTSKLAAVNGILDAMTCYHIYVDAFNNVVTKFIPLFSSAKPVVEWVYSTDSLSILVDPQTQNYPPMADANNMAIVVSEPNGSVGLRATYINTNPESEISLLSLGQPSMKYVQDDTIPDSGTIFLRAQLEVQAGAQIADEVELTTLINPLHELYDGIEINVVNQQGQQIASTGANPFIMSYWSIDTSSRSMTIRASRMQSV